MISIIIPVLNEASLIQQHLHALQALQGVYEIIVVDGGSQDDTPQLATATLTQMQQQHQVIHAPAGRASQLNAGAAQALGDILWFVHIDSQLHPHSPNAITKAIQQGAHYGCFSLYFYDDHHLFMRFIAWSSRLRAQYGPWIFGDQGMFITKVHFENQGGFPALPIMEDLAFSAQLRKQNTPHILPLPIGTSARRFHKGGMWKTFIRMQKMKINYLRGIDPQQLLKHYQ